MLDLTNRKNCFYWQTDRNLTAEDYARIFLKRHDVSHEELLKVLQAGIKTHSGEIVIEDPDENVIKGNVNIVRKITISGTPYVVRMHPKSVKNGYFFVEKLVLDLANQHGLPVPQILEVHEAVDENDMDFILMSLATGETMDTFLAKDGSKERELLLSAGKLMAKIHTISVKGFGPFNNELAKQGVLEGLHPSYRNFVHVGLEENLQRLITFDVLSKEEADAMSSIFEENNFEPLDGPKLVHNDYADWNMLTNGESITGILDWDECHAGDPVADLACWSTFFTMERYAKFLEGYTSAATLPEDYEERFHFYRLRYTISKMALRVKRYQVDKEDKGLGERIRVGKLALIEEAAWFGVGK